MFQPVLTRGAKVLYGPEDGLTLPQGACDGFLEKSRLKFTREFVPHAFHRVIIK